MGWFLFGNNSGKGKGKAAAKGRGGRGKKKTGKRSSASPRPWDPQRTMLGIKAIVGLVAVAVIVLGWSPLHSALSRYAAQKHAARIGVEQVRIRDRPSWMSPLIRQEIRGMVARWVSDDPMDDRGLSVAAEALRRSPWVAQVGQLRRTSGGTVEVTARFRQPVAAVRARDGYHLVDATGVRLPGGPYYDDQARRLGLPIVTGVTGAPPASGQRWGGKDLRAGLALAVALAGEPYQDQIRAVDVSRRDARGRLRLALDTDDGLVVWGLPIGDSGAVEEPAVVKRDRLRRLYRVKGDLDAGGQVVRIYGPTIQADLPATHAGGAIRATTSRRDR